MQPIMTMEEIHDFLDREFPQIHVDGRVLSITDVHPGRLTMRFEPGARHLRPGATVSGPSMVMLADVAAYAVILAHIGPVALAVTTSLNFNFLRKPEQRDLIADCRLLKLGKRLAIGEVSIYSEGSPEVVCHATGTYSIPERR
jgi:uncharacterized protein (TIGR00369 family)